MTFDLINDYLDTIHFGADYDTYQPAFLLREDLFVAKKHDVSF